MENQEPRQLTWREHIRKRPAMYMGLMNVSGFTQILEYFFEDLLNGSYPNPTFEIEFISTTRLNIKITNIDAKKFLLRFNELHSENKIQGGLGLAILLALCSTFLITINDSPTATLLQGRKDTNEIISSIEATEEKSIIIDYTIDNEILKEINLEYEVINDFLKQFAFLNSSLKIISTDKTTDELQRNIFFYPTGIFKQLDIHLSKQLHGVPLLKHYIEKDIGIYSYKIGLCYGNLWPEKTIIKSFAGNTETHMGGSLLDGVLAGLIETIKCFAKKENVAINISKKLVTDGLNLIAIVKGDNLVFAGSTKIKLGMPKVRKEIKEIVLEEMTAYLNFNPAVKEKVLDKFRK
jgi:DNA gyrase/topoisomerase IV subunit B